jgi:hypothetical protein
VGLERNHASHLDLEELGSAVDKDDEYRRQAADAQSQADRTVNAADKEAWLKIAQGWLALIRAPKKD